MLMEVDIMAREVIDSVKKLEAELTRVRKAQKEFSTYSQEQVDKIFLAAAKAANISRITMQPSIFIINIKIQRHAALLKRIRHTVQ